MAQEGLEPSASLVLSESGLPVAYRAHCSETRIVKEVEGLTDRDIEFVRTPARRTKKPGLRPGMETLASPCRSGIRQRLTS